MRGFICMTGGSDLGLFLQIERRNAGGRDTHRLSHTNWANVGDTGAICVRLMYLHTTLFAFFPLTLKCIFFFFFFFG